MGVCEHVNTTYAHNHARSLAHPSTLSLSACVWVWVRVCECVWVCAKVRGVWREWLQTHPFFVMEHLLKKKRTPAQIFRCLRISSVEEICVRERERVCAREREREREREWAKQSEWRRTIICETTRAGKKWRENFKAEWKDEKEGKKRYFEREREKTNWCKLEREWVCYSTKRAREREREREREWERERESQLESKEWLLKSRDRKLRWEKRSWREIG